MFFMKYIPQKQTILKREQYFFAQKFNKIKALRLIVLKTQINRNV